MGRPLATLSTGEFAELLGKSSRTVQNWLRDGMPHRMNRHQAAIVPRDAIAWLIERAQESARAAAEPGDDRRGSAFARKAHIEADLKQLELDERRRRMIPAEEFEEFAEQFVGGFTAVAMGRLTRFERDIVRAKTPADARKITRAQAAALMHGAREMADRLDEEAAGDEPAAA